MKRTNTRTAFAALSVAAALVAGTAQAAVDNREIGHAAPVTTDSALVQGIASGLMNAEVGHFALQVGSVDAGNAVAVYGDTRESLR